MGSTLPGINIKHHVTSRGRFDLVRSDVGGVIGFIPEARWPDKASAGDSVEFVLTSYRELDNHPQRDRLDPASVVAAKSFFDNGGTRLHLFGLCISNESDIIDDSTCVGVLEPLLSRLRINEDISQLACPGAAYLRCREDKLGRVVSDADAIYDALLAHCMEMNHRFLIIDAPKDLHGNALVRWVENMRNKKVETRSYCAVYYPWIETESGLQPPSGAMLGVFSRIASTRGPYGVIWPPANQPIRKVRGLDMELDWQESQELCAAAINTMVLEQGRGVRVYGARTLSKESSWRFINTRRAVSMISEQLRRDNMWAVFETNTPMIWKAIERDVRVRLDEFWEHGVLAGRTAGAEYSIACDAETNDVDSRANGALNVRVNLQPVGTTEQIRIELKLSELGPSA